MDNQARWHPNIRLHDPQQIIQLEAPFMDIAGVMRRPSAIVPVGGNANVQSLLHQDAVNGGGGQTSAGHSGSSGSRSSSGGGGNNTDDPKWESEFLHLFWEEEKRRAQIKSNSKVRKKRIRTPEQKAIEAARKRLARAKEKETLTEAERLERNRKRRLRERMNRYRKLNKIPTATGGGSGGGSGGGAGFPVGMLDMSLAGSMQHHMDGKQV